MTVFSQHIESLCFSSVVLHRKGPLFYANILLSLGSCWHGAGYRVLGLLLFVHNDLKKRDSLHFFFCSANDPINRQGHKFCIRPDPFYLRLLVNGFELHTIFTVVWPAATGHFLILIDS